MLAWIIVIVLLLLFLLLPLGVDVAYADATLSLKVKAGLLKLKLLPGKPKQTKPPKKAQEKVKKPKSAGKLHLTKDDVFTLLGIVFRTLNRFRKHLSIDLLKLHWIAGASDPCDAVMQYGALNAGLSTLRPVAQTVLRIREEDLHTDVSFAQTKPDIDVRVVATIQIWELLLIAICAGAAALRWYLKKRKEARSAEAAAAQKGTE